MRTTATLAGVTLLLAAASPLAAGDPKSVTIRGERFDVWPIEDLAQRGFDVQSVAREENAAWVYLKAINAYVELPKSLVDAFEYAVYTAWPEGETKLEEYLQQPGNRRAIELIHKAADMHAYQMPCVGDPSKSVLSILLPNLSHMRFLAKLMVADARWRVAQERYDEAINAYMAAMRMGGHVGRSITLIEGLVGIAVSRITDRALQNMILGRPLSRKQLKRLLSMLNEHAHHLPTVHRGLRGERTMGPAVVDELCSRPVWFLTHFTSRSESGEISFIDGQTNANPDDGWGRLKLRIGQLIYPDRAIKRNMLDYYDKVLARADRGSHTVDSAAFDEERYIKEVIPRWDVVSRSLLPSLSRAIILGERLKTDFTATRVLIALRTYMLENDGQSPVGLDEIADILPGGSLIDPFSDESLLYRPTGDGFVLYSVGPNLTDDGGQRGERWDTLDMVYSFPPETVDPFDTRGDEE